MKTLCPFNVSRLTKCAAILCAVLVLASEADAKEVVKFSPATVRDVLDCAGTLATRLQASANPERLAPLVTELEAFESRLDQLEKSSDAETIDWKQLLDKANVLRRQIAFTNPRLVEIDKLLFIKRLDARGERGTYHMCDQYYGCNAKAGGGLFVLSNPFGENPKLTNVLENSVVENGRLKGQKLRGSFLSPELSFDGKTILFAHSEAEAEGTYMWDPRWSYHIFKVNVDGSHLVQLTDGSTNDFDPCFLPSGRIVFISERRGGYLRCGRHCPVYTMFSMDADGENINCVSFHETHEWHPSVNHDGMLVYTRWDYVDRDTNVAHHLWTSYPDGRDPRSLHGNYPVKRESRPWMEMSIRAIPGSHKYVATAAAHHGHAFGSLVLIDPSIIDDRAMSQLERLTPEVPFPETDGKRSIRQYQQYATAWPLSEDDYLCAYDRDSKNHGIYWIDRDGNKALIYRDPKIPCLSPIPLRARPTPPMIPDKTVPMGVLTKQSKKSTDDEKNDEVQVKPATISIINIYDSDFEWPKDTTIKGLRIIQVLPKSTAPPNVPRIGVAQQTNARAVLGTVPVESDGSVHFEVPPGKAIYFQALDEQSMAIQSMRSVTYAHAGEHLTCQGCHAPKNRAPVQLTSGPRAFRKPPKKIEPDVSGSNPFNYPRLVQPVLDRNCVECHQQKKAIDLSGKLDGQFTRSYNSLAEKFGFYFDVTNGSINSEIHGGSRTIAGKFGARAAPLLKYLGPEHHGVKLSEEDFHRMTLWLDCNSEFLGAYENAAAQARGEIVHPSLQ